MTATWIAFILYAAAAIALGWSAYRRGGVPARRGVALAGVNALLFVGLLPLFIGVRPWPCFPPREDNTRQW